MAAEQDITRIAQELIDAFNAKDQERFKRTLSPDVVYEEVGTHRTMHGAERWVETWEGWRAALPDVQGTITKTFVSGNTVIQEITWKGTHKGPLMMPGRTIPPSGKSQTTRAAQILTFQGGKIKEDRNYFDMLSLLQQTRRNPVKGFQTRCHPCFTGEVVDRHR